MICGVIKTKRSLSFIDERQPVRGFLDMMAHVLHMHLQADLPFLPDAVELEIVEVALQVRAGLAALRHMELEELELEISYCFAPSGQLHRIGLLLVLREFPVLAALECHFQQFFEIMFRLIVLD